jgi:hypothetical protein
VGTTATQCIPKAAVDANGTATVDQFVATGPRKPAAGMTFAQIVQTDIIPIGNQVIILLYTIALLLFFYGMFKFFFAPGGDQKARDAGKQFIVFGIIGLFVLFSVWGLVNLFLSSLGPIGA